MSIIIDLSKLVFTENSDKIPLLGINAPIINTQIVNTLAGDDEITGTNSQEEPGHSIGIYNMIGALLDTGTGNDTLIGTGTTGIINLGTINTGEGSDAITGVGNSINFSGIYNYGNINTGDNTDVIIGINTSTEKSYGIYNKGIINTDGDNDMIIATGFIGLENIGIINTGDSNDIITGIGKNCGICNYNTINTGNGNDVITGINTTNYQDNGIFNQGIINTGDGEDVVDALQGDFDGTGVINLGNGHDTIKGFGSGSFDGGRGKDKLFFGTGTYSVSSSTKDGFYTINNGKSDMLVTGFGFIGDASNSEIGYSFSSVIGESFTI